MFELRPLPSDGVQAALDKAKQYRLLNDPLAAESICLDVLEIEPDNQDALVMLLLSLTDQFEQGQSTRLVGQARDILPRLQDEASRSYYEGIISERRGKATLNRGGMNSGSVAYDHFRRAMELFESCPEGANKFTEATLRWNTCARILNSNPNVVPSDEGTMPNMLE